MENVELETSKIREFVSNAKAGDFDSFQKLVQFLSPKIFSLALKILRQRQDAEDVVQQTFLSVIEHLGEFRGESSFTTWVYSIATNFSLKTLRKRRDIVGVAEGGRDEDESYRNFPHPTLIAPWRETAEQILERKELREQLDEELGKLDEKYRLVFILRDVEGLSTRESADILGIAEGTIKVRLLRARLFLRERLTERFGDSGRRLNPDHHHERKL